MDLKYTRKNVYKQADGKELEKIYQFAEGYKSFLDSSKTERDAAITAKNLPNKTDLNPFLFQKSLKPATNAIL